MKKTSLILLALFTLLSACELRQKTDSEEQAFAPNMESETLMVELSSEGELVPMDVEASFMSDNKTFAYTFSYDPNLLNLTEAVLDKASPAGPSFLVEGGAEITGYTVWLADLEMIPQLSAVQLFGRYQVYRYAYVEGLCTIERAVVEDSEEGLVLELKLCPAQDAELGMEAFEALLTGLRLKDLE